MKKLGIFLLLSFLSACVTVGMDLIQGLDVMQAFVRLKNPFWMIGSVEFFIVILFLILPFISLFWPYIKRKWIRAD
ncbi:hypothetical protein ACFO25_17335 [Paenactinomyces guangxiensis]|uniref:Uncharacterized protein n=1 Tax=Paenactinomyces guangxiensis TaxID=1490290 RepID=A0A7W1WRY9_9BACL|nr:hypothetical protein [Paenactinomyces guangxiensis]MBA4494771.1 hypothetical protein [Paenactinomyces guangxiensis]MBH8591855.1 hypothetical protein [Paenactinomyces guangxiensis]